MFILIFNLGYAVYDDSTSPPFLTDILDRGLLILMLYNNGISTAQVIYEIGR
jgi:hypothetical protein